MLILVLFALSLIVEDGSLLDICESDVGEFWNLFRGS